MSQAGSAVMTAGQCGGSQADAPASSSSSTLGMDLAFRDLSFTASRCPFTSGGNRILEGVCGELRAGELSAIMGPSGSGKSTLLNILAGYMKGGYTGEITVDGRRRDLGSFLKRSSYILQEDALHPLLTVAEIMSVAADLKLGPAVSPKQKHSKVREILEALGLSGSAETMTGKLSGGQRRRLSVALELVRNPPVIFLDEPTTGLDSVSSKQCMGVLKGLAREGRTVVVTLHQPSALALAQLDHLLCLASGRVVFAGRPSSTTPFLASLSLPCPPYHNPADFLLEVCSGDFGEQTDRLVEAMRNGESEAWRNPRDASQSPARPGANGTARVVSGVQVEEKPSLCARVKSLVWRSAGECGRRGAAAGGGGAAAGGGGGCAPPDPFLPLGLDRSPTSFFAQVAILTCRAFLIMTRDQFLTHCRLLMHLLIGLLIGFFYQGIGNDAATVFDNFSLLFFSVIFLAFSASSCVIVSFPSEVPIIRRESFNQWYSVRAYYLSTCVSDAPVQVACSTVFCVIIYWMSQQPRDWHRFALFLTMCLVTSLLAQSLGYLVGASMKVQNGVVWGPLSLMPWVVLSGYFLHVSDAPPWSAWLFRASYLRYGLEGLVLAVYGFARPPLPCSQDYCHFVAPTKFLRELGMAGTDFWSDVAVLLAMWAASRLLAYFVLVYQLCHKR